ncbi:hypothetical protein Tco_0480537 [Tanacetum coccineum]
MFMGAHKCLELAKRFSNKVPRTVDEMMIRVDDFVQFEEALASTELPKGEAYKHFKKPYHSGPRRDDQSLRGHARGTYIRVISGTKRISEKRTKNQAKTDKTKHGMEKRGKAKVKSKPSQQKSKSTPTKSTVKTGADTEEYLMGLPEPI